MLKIAVVGPGLMGKQHIASIDALEGIRLCAIVAPISLKNQTYSSDCNVPMFNDLQECIDCISPDGVIIASPNEFHLQQAMMCIKNLIPVLIEKPLAINVSEGQRIVDYAESKQFKHKLMVGHHRAYSPIIQHSSQLIKSGVLGRVVAFQGSAQFYKPDDYFEQGDWRTRLGGGPILINMIHEISNMRELLGEIESVQVMTSSAVRGYQVEDTAVFNFKFISGALGSFVLSDAAASSKSWELTSGENPSYPCYNDENCYSVSGTLGSLDIPSMNLKTYYSKLGSSWLVSFNETVNDVKRHDPLLSQLRKFVAVIEGKELPLVSVIDGHRNLSVIEAIKRAELSGCVEKVIF